MNPNTSYGEPVEAERNIRVWDLPTRLFHWTLVLAFLTAYLSGDADDWSAIHALAGYLVAVLIGFRLLWGLVGSRYARFSAFVRGPAAAFRYLASLLSRRPEHHVGHNPAGGLAIVALLGLGALVTLSGWATWNGIFGEAAEDLHEGLANTMLAVVAVHLAGVVVGSLRHRENLVAAMFSGRKRGAPAAAIASNYGWVAGFLVVLLVAVGVAWGRGGPGALPGLSDRPAEEAGAEGWRAGGEERDDHDRRERRGRRGRDDD